MNTYSINVPAGKYILGDPCYHIREDHWDILLKNCDYFSDNIGEIFGHTILSFGTRYGDGLYKGNFNSKFPVDSGMIGLIPIDYLIEFSVEYNPECASVVNFKDDTECWSDDGTMHFGKYIIKT
jgi:hypothetical protein